MSAGCAIITSNVSGCPETVGNTGIIIEPKNVEQLKNEITKLTKKPELIKKLGTLTRKRIINNFDWKNIIKLYEEVLG